MCARSKGSRSSIAQTRSTSADASGSYRTLLARLVEAPIVGILGPSGIGKSSLLRAGVLQALSAGLLPGSGGWRQALLRPGEHPDADLSRALGGERLGQVLERISPGERLVIAVDQLEELFTLCKRENERAAFLEQLAAAAEDRERRAAGARLAPRRLLRPLGVLSTVRLTAEP